MFNFSHAARVTPNRVCCNALLAAYARAKPPQYQRVRGKAAAAVPGGERARCWGRHVYGCLWEFKL